MLNLGNLSSYDIGKALYKNVRGEPFEMTTGEVVLFDLIFKRKYPRNHIMTYTQYGKSDIIAMATLTRVATLPEPWAIVAPTAPKAKIIMSYIIQHTFDNPFTTQMLAIDPGETLEHIRRERSKEKLTFKVGERKYGEVFTLSAQARRKQEVVNALMGFGSPNVVEDESALIPDTVHSIVMRMLGGHTDNFLAKVGNPFVRNHFLRSFEDPNYHKFVVDYHQGLAEGRITESFIEEMRKEALFNVLYECQFPEADVIDTAGYMPLFTEQEIENALTDDFVTVGFGNMGADVADTGENESVIVERFNNIARVAFGDRNINPFDFGVKLGTAIDDDKIDLRNIAVDRIGVGAGIPGQMRAMGKPIYGENVGEKCDNEPDRALYYNRRAYLAFQVQKWIKAGGRLYRDNRWYQLLTIKYKESAGRRLQLMSKKEMRALGLKSPDAFDALCLTFSRPQVGHKDTVGEARFNKRMAAKKKKELHREKPFSMTNY